MKIFRIAWRNVWRNRRRSLVTIAAMSLALVTMILYAGLMDGYIIGMERSILDLEVGDVQIFAADYRDNPSIYTRIEDPEALLAPLADAGFDASARVLAYGMASSGESSAGVEFRGIDVERDAEVSDIRGEVADGRWLDAADPKGVVIGRRLARTLAVAPGDELVVLTTGADGAMAYDLYAVRGVLRGVGDATDRAGVFLTQQALRDLIVVPDGAHQIIVRRPEGLTLEAAATRVEALIDADQEAKTWRQLLPTIASMMDAARGAFLAMFVIVYLAVGILLLNAMLMAVFERVREFGVLKAIGAGPFDVVRLVAAESSIQIAIAIAIGVAISVPAAWYLEHTGIDLESLSGVSVLGIAMDPVWRANVTTSMFTGPIFVLLGIVSVAVLYPAVRAAWIQPVEAMRHH